MGQGMLFRDARTYDKVNQRFIENLKLNAHDRAPAQPKFAPYGAVDMMNFLEKFQKNNRGF